MSSDTTVMPVLVQSGEILLRLKPKGKNIYIKEEKGIKEKTARLSKLSF
jgi:hypothetical protein